MNNARRRLWFWAACLAGALTCLDARGEDLQQIRFSLEIPAPQDSAGGIIAADVNDDGKIEILVSVPGHLAVFTADGRRLWIKQTDLRVGGQSESQGLPGHNGPGVTGGDADGDGKPLWTTDGFVSCAHNGARLADLDGDGRDEVLGATILGPDGKLLVEAAPFRGHMDSVFAADVRKDVPGIEVVLLEEGSNHVQLLGLGGGVWREANRGAEGRGREPQNAALGRFAAGSDEVFIWCRSRAASWHALTNRPIDCTWPTWWATGARKSSCSRGAS